jgi:hypothetical protein
MIHEECSSTIRTNDLSRYITTDKTLSHPFADREACTYEVDYTRKEKQSAVPREDGDARL